MLYDPDFARVHKDPRADGDGQEGWGNTLYRLGAHVGCDMLPCTYYLIRYCEERYASLLAVVADLNILWCST